MNGTTEDRNLERADRGHDVLERYALEMFGGPGALDREDTVTVLGDLLADLMHYLGRLDPETLPESVDGLGGYGIMLEALERGAYHYRYEVEGDDLA